MSLVTIETVGISSYAEIPLLSANQIAENSQVVARWCTHYDRVALLMGKFQDGGGKVRVG